MLLQKIELHNFRQFYGKHEIAFSTDSRRNVTLIHAENTFGKTTILNAVLWAFFEDVTGNFEGPEKILNFDAAEEGETEASVTVEFEFKSAQYSVKRVFDHNATGRNRTKFYAYKISGGNYDPIRAPETFIGSVVPRQMAKYFFFDGEAAATYSAENNHKAVGEAVRNILGCFLAERAIQDLQDLMKDVDRELGESTDDSELKELEERLSKKTEEREQYEGLKGKIKEELATYEEQLSSLEEELRTMEGAEDLANLRQEKERQLGIVRGDLREAQLNILHWVGHESLSIVAERLASESLDFIDEASLKGRIPSPYDEEFVTGLLESEVCVCGRPLKPESNEWKSVASLLKKATNKEVLDRVVRARALIKTLKRDRVAAPDKLLSQQRKITEKAALIENLQQEIAEIGKKLEGIHIEEVAAKERSRKELKKNIGQKNREFGAVKAKITELENACRSLSDAIDRLAAKNSRTAKLAFRRQMLDQAQGILKHQLKHYEQLARKEIEDQTNEILAVVAHNHRRCCFSKDFSVELIKEDGAPCPKSGGEKQLLSLVFISSLIKYAASRKDDKDMLLRPGTVAPLILDSPFGQLDPDYRTAAATHVPTLSPQVVLLVSGSQGDEKVLEAIEPYIGKEYVLISEHKAEKGKKKPTALIRNGKKYVTLQYSQDHNQTRIEEVI